MTIDYVRLSMVGCWSKGVEVMRKICWISDLGLPLALSVVALPVGGCYSGLDGGLAVGETGPTTGPNDSPEAPGETTGTETTGTETSATGDDPDDGCADIVDIPLRRLTSREYRASVLALLDVDVPEVSTFPLDEKNGQFGANVKSALGAQNLEEYMRASMAVAARALEARPDRLQSCEGIAPEDQDNCVEANLTSLLARAYRRPADPEELQQMLDFYGASVEEWGREDADQMFIEAVLLSPQFLYVLPPYDGAVQSSLASRLSYFLTGAPPDDALRELAVQGALSDRETLEAEVDRMLNSDLTVGSMPGLFSEWVGLERMDEAHKLAEPFPTWSDALRADMLEETERFIEQVIAQDGGIYELLTSRETVVSPQLAELYGVAEQHSGSGWEPVVLPEEERAGMLTQASFLTGHAHADSTSWVLRGRFIRENLLCDALPPPPDDVDLSVPNDDGRLENPECSPCHFMMDPIGRAFDRYDAIGQYAETAADGNMIPAAGEVFQGGNELDILGGFSSPVALAEAMGDSESIRRCMSRQFYRFAHRRDEHEEERCQIAEAGDRFVETEGDFRALMRSIALSPSFVGLSEGQ